MSYVLGDVTLPTPSSFKRKYIDTQTINERHNGTTTRKIVNRKEEFTLEFMHLTPAEINSILSEFNLMMVRPFSVSEDNLTISPTGVIIEIAKREYGVKGVSYRENFTMILTEVI